MPVTVKGTGGGSVTLTASTAAADTTLTLPNTNGTVALTASPTFTGDVTFPGTGIWNSSGNVGVGTNSPLGAAGNKLDVRGSVTAGQATVGRVSLDQGTVSNSGYVAFWNSDLSVRQGYVGFATLAGGGTMTVSADTNNALVFQTNALERARIDTSGNWYMNSGYGSSAVAYGCRAWANYDGSTPTIRASGGFSSITRTATGKFTGNFNFTMPDTNYTMVGGTYLNVGVTRWTIEFTTTALTTTTMSFETFNGYNGSNANLPYCWFAVMR